MANVPEVTLDLKVLVKNGVYGDIATAKTGFKESMRTFRNITIEDKKVDKNDKRKRIYTNAQLFGDYKIDENNIAHICVSPLFLNLLV